MRATTSVAAFFVAIAVGVAASIALGDPSREGERYVSVPWRADPNDGKPAGRKIRIIATYHGGFRCQYRFHRASTRETSKSVTIKVLVHKREMKQDQYCTLELGGDFATVRLEKELGDRQLRHAPVTSGEEERQ
jgi:hypothetical protein